MEEDNMNFVQVSGFKDKNEPISSVLIVGMGSVLSKQFIDVAIPSLQNKLWQNNVRADYFFIALDEVNESNILKKMNAAQSNNFRHLLLITQEDNGQIVGKAPLIVMNLSLKLFEKDHEDLKWQSSLQLSGKIYKKEHCKKMSDLILFHLKANQFVASK